jgi:hypothetical protein
VLSTPRDGKKTTFKGVDSGAVKWLSFYSDNALRVPWSALT